MNACHAHICDAYVTQLIYYITQQMRVMHTSAMHAYTPHILHHSTNAWYNIGIRERWGARVEYHFQEFNEPYAPS